MEGRAGGVGEGRGEGGKGGRWEKGNSRDRRRETGRSEEGGRENAGRGETGVGEGGGCSPSGAWRSQTRWNPLPHSPTYRAVPSCLNRPHPISPWLPRALRVTPNRTAQLSPPLCSDPSGPQPVRLHLRACGGGRGERGGGRGGEQGMLWIISSLLTPPPGSPPSPSGLGRDTTSSQRSSLTPGLGSGPPLGSPLLHLPRLSTDHPSCDCFICFPSQTGSSLRAGTRACPSRCPRRGQSRGCTGTSA